MTRYFKAKLSVKIGENTDIRPADVLSLRLSSAVNSGDAAELEIVRKYDFDALDNTGQLIDEGPFANGTAWAIIDNTDSDQDVRFIGWSEEGVVNTIGWNIRAGHFVKFPFYIGEGVTGVYGAASPNTANVRLWIVGEST